VSIKKVVNFVSCHFFDFLGDFDPNMLMVNKDFANQRGADVEGVLRPGFLGYVTVDGNQKSGGKAPVEGKVVEIRLFRRF